MREISDILRNKGYNVSKSTVDRWIKEMMHYEEKRGDGEHVTPIKTGRPSAIGDETGKKMLEIVEDDRDTTASDLFRDEVNHNEVCVHTIRRFLNKAGFLA